MAAMDPSRGNQQLVWPYAKNWSYYQRSYDSLQTGIHWEPFHHVAVSRIPTWHFSTLLLWHPTIGYYHFSSKSWTSSIILGSITNSYGISSIEPVIFWQVQSFHPSFWWHVTQVESCSMFYSLGHGKLYLLYVWLLFPGHCYNIP